MARKDTLFAVLSRAPWWISVLAAGALFAGVRQFLPDIVALASALPFLGIAAYAGWRQLRAPGAANVDEILGKVRAMPWENFAAIVAESFRRDGYAVNEAPRGAADLKCEKGGRLTLVSCRRWKVAQTGVGPLRELLAAKEANGAAACVYVAAGDFSANAREYAATKSIRLVHGAELAHLVARAGHAQPDALRSR